MFLVPRLIPEPRPDQNREGSQATEDALAESPAAELEADAEDLTERPMKLPT